jgi:exodeoxyribonuclease V alpha subunit
MDCAQSLRRLLARPVSLDNGSLLRAIEWGIRCTRMDLTMEQVEAVRTALLSSCSIITGGPGTGKTTVIRALIGALRHLNEEVQLCAPTGRAAKRMTEATGMEARTIHRLLEFRPETSSFGRNRHYPVAATTVIVDEVSMIDVELMASLLEALSTGTRLVLVGDKDQLESVGPGAVLRDLIDSESLPCTRFSKIHRQAEASLIVVNSHRILNGQWLRSEAGAGRPADFFFMERPDPQQCLETVKELLTTRIPRKFGFDPIRDVQLITPMYKGTIGAQNLNAELQAALNPSGKEVRKGERAFRIGDRVMQLRNNYDKEVFNGDVGFVEGAGDQGLRVRMSDGRSVAYEDSELDELTLAYAVTVHKAQGSEYPAVVMAVHTQHFVMLRRNLLYTGITRGKKLVVLVGTERAARMAIRNDRTRTRFTQLAARLRKMRE